MGKYHNGSDMLLRIGNDCLGHCTTHSMTMSSDSKERAVKPAATVQNSGTGFWRAKSVTGLSCTLHGEGFIFAGEAEMSYGRLLNLMAQGDPVGFDCFQRKNSSSPYVSGFAVITNLERTDPADDDSTYSIDLEVSGTPLFYTSNFYNAPAQDSEPGPTEYAGLEYPDKIASTIDPSVPQEGTDLQGNG